MMAVMYHRYELELHSFRHVEPMKVDMHNPPQPAIRHYVTPLCLTVVFNNVTIYLLTYKHGTAPSYLADKLQWTADLEAWRHLRSASSLSLSVRHCQLLGLPCCCCCSYLEQSAPTCHSRPHRLCLFIWGRLKAFLSRRSFPWLAATFFVVPACALKLSFFNTLIVIFTHSPICRGIVLAP